MVYSSNERLGGLALAIVLGASVVQYFRPKQRQLPVPPGPPGLPVLGNVLEIPDQYSWLRYREWAKQYGDVFHISAIGRHIVVLNSREAVNELLIQRGVNYSDRPIMTMAAMSGWEDMFVLLQHNDPRWRAARKISQQVLNPRVVHRYNPVQEQSVRRFLRKMLLRPDALNENSVWLASSTIMKVVYDHEMADEGSDPLVEVFEKALTSFTESAKPGWIVDLFPSLRHMPAWIPGASFVQLARAWKADADSMYHAPFDRVKNAMIKGGAQAESHSFVAELLQGEDGKEVVPGSEEEDLIRKTTGSMYAAASDTTSATVQTFYLAMIVNPEAQRKAQDEITSIVGHDRLPSFEDRSSLPYVEAIFLEVLRWNPVAPLGFPHCYHADDTYRGWRIPAGTMLIPNVWHILHDESVYPDDPMAFKPERFLDPKGRTSGFNPDPRTIIFGFGRRECPGRYLAEDTIWLTIALTLASLHLKPAKGLDGVEVSPVASFMGGISSRPYPFKMAIELRSEAASHMPIG